MELNINELEDDAFLEEYLREHSEEDISEDIPENKIHVKSQNKKVYFTQEEPIKPMHQSIPKAYAKKVRPHVPIEQPQVSYDDILNKMGMFVADGKLQLKNTNSQTQSQPVTQSVNPEQNSYIYNKYFSKETKKEPTIRVPKNIYEYRDMLIHDIIQKQRIKQIKSTQLVLPNSNMYANGNGNGNMNLNKLFYFSNR